MNLGPDLRLASNSHAPPPGVARDFDSLDMLGHGDKSFVNRAMVQDTAERFGDDGFQNELARAPSPGSERRKIEKEEERERAERALKDPRAGGAGQAFARSAVTRAVDTAALPVTVPARALEWAGVPNRAAHLSANEAWAEAESLARGETTAETRERHRLTADAHPTATELGGAFGDAVGGLVFGGTGGTAMQARSGKLPSFPRPRTAPPKTAPVTAEQVTAALKRQSSGMREESLTYLREGGKPHGGPPTIGQFPGKEPHIIDGRHRITVAAENGQPVVIGDFVEYGPKGGVKRYLRGVEIPTGAQPAPKSAEPVVSFTGDVPGTGLMGAARSGISGAAAEQEHAYLEGRDPNLAGAALSSAAMGAGMGTAMRMAATRGAKPQAPPLYVLEEAATDAAPRILGRKLDAAQAERLVGNHPEFGGKLAYSVERGTHPNSIRIVTSHPEVQIERQYVRESNGDLVAKHEIFKLPARLRKSAGKGGIGKDVLRQQVGEYDRLGVARIDLLADADGRAVWPKMGFDLKRPTDFARIRDAFDRFLVAKGLNPADYPADSIVELARRYRDGVGDEFLTSKAAPIMELTVDLRSPVGDRLRRYLGLRERASSAASSSSSQALTSSSKRVAASTKPSSSASAGASGAGAGAAAGLRGSIPHNVTTPGDDAISPEMRALRALEDYRRMRAGGGR